jgi:hypothetical protein
MNNSITLIFDDEDIGFSIWQQQVPEKNTPLIRRVTDMYRFFERLINTNFHQEFDCSSNDAYENIRNTVLGYLYSPVEVQLISEALSRENINDSAGGQVFRMQSTVDQLMEYDNGFDHFFLEYMSTYWIALSHHHVRIQPAYHHSLGLSKEEWADMTTSKAIDLCYRATQELDKKRVSYIRYYEDIKDNRISSVLSAILIEMARRGKVVRKCKNCGRYFVPSNRSDAIYCDNASPLEPKLTCKEYGSQRLSYIRQREDELSKLSRNILSKKGTLAKRNPDNSTYRENYDYFRYERKKWNERLKASPDNEQLRYEYRCWLTRMDKQYSVPEAKGFVYPST